MKNKEFWIEKFEQFLKDNNCYEEFEKNILELNYIKITKEVLYEDEAISFLYKSFVWCASEQEHHFWSELNEKWIKLIEQEEND